MARVSAPAFVAHDPGEIVALGAEGVRPAVLTALGAQVRIHEQVRHQSTGSRSRAELIPALQDVRENGPMRTIRALAPEFPIVIAVVAVRTQNSVAHSSARCLPVKVQHVRKEAGLWQHAAAILEDRMT